jgi:hypothetical protein
MPSSRAHKFPRCERTGKVRYRTVKDAKLALRFAAHSRTRAALEGTESSHHCIRWYRCACGGFHVTSQPQRDRSQPATAPDSVLSAIARVVNASRAVA